MTVQRAASELRGQKKAAYDRSKNSSRPKRSKKDFILLHNEFLLKKILHAPDIKKRVFCPEYFALNAYSCILNTVKKKY
ncbi:hypothetical protein ACK1LH_08820 [Metabacillus indicus]|uniref:hypothetical protein n=1 Tax=Metabacillus TaxID=2675233 RepID=UPI0019395D00|nr:hypothetical protein [Metabacillus sp. cB07]